MKVLILDISLSTGWSTFVNGKLCKYGVLQTKKTTEGFGEYPLGIVLAAEHIAAMILTLVQTEKPDQIVIEETNLGRNRFSQKVLEFLHFATLKVILPICKVKYMDSSEWRKILGVKLSAEDRAQNKVLAAEKRKAEKKGVKLDKKALGIVGKITLKHVALRLVNAEYGFELKPKDDDIADAICVGWAYCVREKIFNKGMWIDDVIR